MIYISTGGERLPTAHQTSCKYIKHGFTNIELSGGSYDQYAPSNLLNLAKNGINLQVHNYFPPPRYPFVLNLASMNEDISTLTFNHILKSLQLSTELGMPRYSFHAGFLLDPKPEELGRRIGNRVQFPRVDALNLFIERVNKLASYAATIGADLLIENNVLSHNNNITFPANPFLMTSSEECVFVMENTLKNVNLLIDVAHLKVSSQSEGFNPIDFLNTCRPWTKAYHLSDNNGKVDSNKPFSKNSWFWPHLLRNLDYYSLEVYNIDMLEMNNQYTLASSLLSR